MIQKSSKDRCQMIRIGMTSSAARQILELDKGQDTFVRHAVFSSEQWPIEGGGEFTIILYEGSVVGFYGAIPVDDYQIRILNEKTKRWVTVPVAKRTQSYEDGQEGTQKEGKNKGGRSEGSNTTD